MYSLALSRAQIIFTLEFAVDFGADTGRGHGRLHRGAQPGTQVAQALTSTGIGFGRGRVDVDDKVELAGQVVDDRDFFGQQQLDVGQPQIVGRLGVG